MAFGAGATAVDNAGLNRAKVIHADAVMAMRKNYGVIGALIGAVNDQHIDGKVQAQRLVWVNGQKMKFYVNASSETVAKVATQAAAIAARTRDAFNNFGVSAEFNMTHYSQKWDIDAYDYELVKGDVAEFGAYTDNARKIAAEWLVKQWATDFMSSNTQARATLGGAPYIIDDTNGYIGTRSDGAHTNLRSYVSAAGAAISLTGNVLTAQTNLQDNGAWPTLGVLPTALHAKLHGQVISAGTYNMNAGPSGTDIVGSPVFIANGTRFILDSGLTSDYMLLFNEEDWRFFLSEASRMSTIMEDPSSEDAYVLHLRSFAGTACLNPKRQGKVTGLS